MSMSEQQILNDVTSFFSLKFLCFFGFKTNFGPRNRVVSVSLSIHDEFSCLRHVRTTQKSLCSSRWNRYCFHTSSRKRQTCLYGIILKFVVIKWLSSYGSKCEGASEFFLYLDLPKLQTQQTSWSISNIEMSAQTVWLESSNCCIYKGVSEFHLLFKISVFGRTYSPHTKTQILASVILKFWH